MAALFSNPAGFDGKTLEEAPIPTEAPAPGPIRPALILALLGVILAAGTILRINSHRGVWGTDDAEYAHLAHAMSTGQYGEFVQENYIDAFNAPAQLPGRLGMVVPLAVLFRIGGVNEVTVAFYPLLASVASILVAFFAGRLLFGPLAGLIAAALWAAFPEDVSGATYYLPDGISNLYASLGVLGLLVCLAKPADARRRILFGLGAGLCFGISWLTKESIVYLVPFAGFLMVLDFRRNARAAVPLWGAVALASGGILVTEMVAYQILRGDFMLRMHETERSHVQAQSYLFYEGSRFGWPVGGSYLKALVKRLFLDGPAMIFFSPRYLYLPLFGTLAAAHAVYRRDESFLVPAVWLGSLAFMYNFASASFDTYAPLVLYDRYLYPLVLPASLLTAGLVAKLLSERNTSSTTRPESVFWGGAIACMLLLAMAWGAFREMRDMPGVRTNFRVREVADIVSPMDRIYTDPLSQKSLDFHWGYPESSGFVDFEGMDAGAIAPGSYVLVDDVRLNWLQVNVSMWLTEDYGYHRPSFADSPPEWERVWSSGPAVLYRVGSS